LQSNRSDNGRDECLRISKLHESCALKTYKTSKQMLLIQKIISFEK